MDTPAMSSQADEGQVSTPETPQGTEPGTQVPAQHQETASIQVENSDLNASSPEDSRKASDFETARQIKSLAKIVRSMQQAFERSSQSAPPQGSPTQPAAPQLTVEELQKDPVGAIQRLVQAQISGLKGELPQHLQQLTQMQRQVQTRQEALRLIKTNGLVKADPEGQDRIADILTEEDDDGNSLEKYSLQNPKHAAQLALKEYQARYGNGMRRSQAAPTKAQMQTTATAVKSGAPNSNLEQEAAQLYRQVLADPTLMSNREFRAKLDSFDKKSRMEKTLQNQ